MRPLRWYALAGLIATATPTLAQQAESLGRPIVELDEPFSRVTGLRELPDGRVLVSDARERLLHLVNLSTGALRRISREGAGPREYRAAGVLLPMPRGETILVDAGNRRYLRIDSDGEPLETIGTPALPVGQGPPALSQMAAFALLPPRGIDTTGRVYFEPFTGLIPGQPVPDSVPILRWAVGTDRVDSVGWVPRRSSNVVFDGSEVWQVAPDGRIARITPDPYQVIWVNRAGQATAGPVVPFTPIRVTEAERQAERAAQANRRDQMMAAANSAQMRAGIAGALPDLVFAPTKPPFLGTGSVVTDPAGRIWILRTRAHGDSIPSYDIFDGTGRLERRISLAAGSRLVGFGPQSVYLVRTDEDDLEYLQKFALP